MASAQVVEMSVTNNSPSQYSYLPDDLFQSRYATPGFKPFSELPYAFSRSYVVSMPGVFFFCIRKAMFSLVKWNLLKSYAVSKLGKKGKMTVSI